MYNKLNLVNACLRSIGNDQVGDLDNPDVDTDIAITTVEETIVDVLSTGWWFNTEENWKMTPNENGEIFISNGIIDLRTYRCSSDVKLVKRSGKLYNMHEHTFNMTSVLQGDGTIDLDFLMNLDLSDCPIAAQNYMREKAINKFLLDMEGDALKISKSETRVLMYLADLQREHFRNSKYNVYQHSGVQDVLVSMQSVNNFAGAGGNTLGGGSNI